MRKLLSLAVVAVFCLALYGCGEEKKATPPAPVGGSKAAPPAAGGSK